MKKRFQLILINCFLLLSVVRKWTVIRQRSSWKRGLAYLVAFPLLLAFQNCNGGFKAISGINNSTPNLSSTGSGNEIGNDSTPISPPPSGTGDGAQVLTPVTYSIPASTGSADNQLLVQNVIDTAVNSGAPSKVVFGHGDYRFNCPAQSGFVLKVINAQSLELVGQEDTRLVINQASCGVFFATGSTNIAFRHFKITYDPLPFSQGTILSINPLINSIDVQLNSGQPDLTASIFPQEGYDQHKISANIFVPQTDDSAGPKLKYSAHIPNDYFFYPSSVASLGNGSWRITMDGSNHDGLLDLVAGDRYVQSNRTPTPVALLVKNQNFEVTQVNIDSGPGMGIVLSGNSGTALLDRVMIQPNQAKGALQSTNADAIHVKSDRAQLTISNSFLAGSADDAINISTLGAPVLANGILDLTGTSGVFNESVSILNGDIFQVIRVSDFTPVKIVRLLVLREIRLFSMTQFQLVNRIWPSTRPLHLRTRSFETS